MNHSEVSEKLSVAGVRKKPVVQSLGTKIQANPIMETGKSHQLSDYQ
jgi:hypothetical protein